MTRELPDLRKTLIGLFAVIESPILVFSAHHELLYSLWPSHSSLAADIVDESCGSAVRLKSLSAQSDPPSKTNQAEEQTASLTQASTHTLIYPQVQEQSQEPINAQSQARVHTQAHVTHYPHAIASEVKTSSLSVQRQATLDHARQILSKWQRSIGEPLLITENQEIGGILLANGLYVMLGPITPLRLKLEDQIILVANKTARAACNLWLNLNKERSRVLEHSREITTAPAPTEAVLNLSPISPTNDAQALNNLAAYTQVWTNPMDTLAGASLKEPLGDAKNNADSMSNDALESYSISALVSYSTLSNQEHQTAPAPYTTFSARALTQPYAIPEQLFDDSEQEGFHTTNDSAPCSLTTERLNHELCANVDFCSSNSNLCNTPSASLNLANTQPALLTKGPHTAPTAYTANTAHAAYDFHAVHTGDEGTSNPTITTPISPTTSTISIISTISDDTHIKSATSSSPLFVELSKITGLSELKGLSKLTQQAELARQTELAKQAELAQQAGLAKPTALSTHTELTEQAAAGQNSTLHHTQTVQASSLALTQTTNIPSNLALILEQNAWSTMGSTTHSMTHSTTHNMSEPNAVSGAPYFSGKVSGETNKSSAPKLDIRPVDLSKIDAAIGTRFDPYNGDGIKEAFEVELSDKDLQKVWTVRPHNLYRNEVLIQEAIREGDVEKLQWAYQLPNKGKIGILGLTPLRSWQNHAHLHNVLGSRAAIDAGVTPEEAYTLSDKLFLVVETINDPFMAKHMRYVVARAFAEMVHHHRELVGDLGGDSVFEPPLIRKARSIIQKNLTDKITLGGLASKLGCSEQHLCRLFKATHKMSIMQFVTKQRINLAKDLLRESDTSISDIAALLQFSSSAHFCRVFKQQEQLSPAKWRMQHALTL